MSAIRIVPVLLILGGLVMFALQNMSPALPLVILGTATQPLPLALWIGGAIASGAATTLLISGLSGLGRSTRRAPSRPAANRFSGSSAPRNPFARAAAGSVSGNASGSTSRGASTSTRLQDDWENRGQAKDEWDDWEEPKTARPSSFNDSSASSSSSFRNPQPEIRDRTDDDWRNWDGYEDSHRNDRRESPNPEPRAPRRTDFEVKRDPATRYQSGSTYSYGYNQPDNSDFEDVDSRREDLRREDAPERPGVYDAEYRVITPPYRPDPEDAPAPQDDWKAVEEELADEPFSSDLDSSNPDRNQRDRRTP